VADQLLAFIPLPANEISRLRGWMCFASALTILLHRPGAAVGLLFMALILDSADGAVARRQGQDSPQTDRAMDMFAEFVVYTAYFVSYPGTLSTLLITLWVIPKTLWIVRYAARQRPSALRAGQVSTMRQMVSIGTLLQDFPFVHLLSLLLLAQWAFAWTPP